MQRQLRFTEEADQQLSELENDPAKKGVLKQVQKMLGLLETNPKHPGLHSHEYQSLAGAKGERVWEVYAHKIRPREPIASSFTMGRTKRAAKNVSRFRPSSRSRRTLSAV